MTHLDPSPSHLMPYPINPDPQDGETGVNIFGYTPSLAVAVFGVVFFAVSAGVNSAFCIVRKVGLRSYHW